MKIRRSSTYERNKFGENKGSCLSKSKTIFSQMFNSKPLLAFTSKNLNDYNDSLKE